ncbi:MAG: iron-sulfur cluster insertion protein ErpA [Nitratireductor sp.]|jgi:iron-sulfur cluster assembly accessory protein|nr:iron-sulfur cluster insertion protein ErpA [Nitratireductor sp.]
MEAETLEKPPIEVTQSALKRVASILKSEPGKNALRISVEGGGCSGFSYRYDLVNEESSDDDFVVEAEGARVLIDSVSLQYMTGAKVDFVDDLMGQSFQIMNPNAVASCGCGTSFSL